MVVTKKHNNSGPATVESALPRKNQRQQSITIMNSSSVCPCSFLLSGRLPVRGTPTRQRSADPQVYKIKPCLFACWRVYDILGIFVPGPKHPLAKKLFDMFGVNHGVERLWPIPWHVTWGCPNQVRRRHPHTMCNDPCAWFGPSPIPSTARVGRSVTGDEEMLQLGYWWCRGLMSWISWFFTNILTLTRSLNSTELSMILRFCCFHS